MIQEHEQINIVIVGHVDHGKSTVIGRLLADTGSLPQGKLEQVHRNCLLNSKPFEYAFLLDALKDEQAQGITIDTARCFFKTAKRHYIIIDAPGHIEFLKNMISGAARAEAALLVIDAAEGVKENSRRHGVMLSLLGIRQVGILVNKMDLVDYCQSQFDKIRSEFDEFLEKIGVKPKAYVPISARNGDNLVTPTDSMNWYDGPSVLELLDQFKKEKSKEDQPFRLPVQDIYKFTANEDTRRIIAGTVEAGRIGVGDRVVFLPSGKKTVIQSIEGFNQEPRSEVSAGHPAGFTIDTQIYIKPGEIMCRCDQTPTNVGSLFRANLFWMGKDPMVKGKKYKLKLVTSRATVTLKTIEQVMDASDLTVKKDPVQVNRHDVAECVLQTIRPIAYDLSQEIEATGRFVIVDHYEIVGGGIIVANLEENSIKEPIGLGRDFTWDRSLISPEIRADRYGQKAKFIVFTGSGRDFQQDLAKRLEESLFRKRCNVYYLSFTNLLLNPDSVPRRNQQEREEQIRKLGELGRIFTDAGQIFITTIPELDDLEVDLLKYLNHPNEVVVINIGFNRLEENMVSLDFDAHEETGVILDGAEKFLYQREILSGLTSLVKDATSPYLHQNKKFKISQR